MDKSIHGQRLYGESIYVDKRYMDKSLSGQRLCKQSMCGQSLYGCNGVEWSKDRTQAAESIKWRPQQAYGSNQVLLAQPQTIFSTPKILTLTAA